MREVKAQYNARSQNNTKSKALANKVAELTGKN